MECDENRNDGAGVIKAVEWALLAAGILLILFGVNAMNSASSDISPFSSGVATDRAVWMLVGGNVMLAAGLAGLLSAFRKS